MTHLPIAAPGSRTVLIPGLLLVFLSGCAVHYYDAKTGTEHLWGLGHMTMKVCPPKEGVEAIIKGTEITGFKAGTDEDGFSLAAGWDNRRRIYVTTTNGSVRLEWPDGEFFNVRIGSLPPFRTNLNSTQPQIAEEKKP